MAIWLGARWSQTTSQTTKLTNQLEQLFLTMAFGLCGKRKIWIRKESMPKLLIRISWFQEVNAHLILIALIHKTLLVTSFQTCVLVQMMLIVLIQLILFVMWVVSFVLSVPLMLTAQIHKTPRVILEPMNVHVQVIQIVQIQATQLVI